MEFEALIGEILQRTLASSPDEGEVVKYQLLYLHFFIISML